MVVICKKATMKLVKGLPYQVVSLENSNKDKIGKVWIKDIGCYTVNNFETTDGEPLPKIDIKRKKEDIEYPLEFSKLLKGDILICKTDSYKTLVKGGMYKIDELSSVSKQIRNWSGVIYTHIDNYVRFEGVSRKLMFSSWKFKKLSTDDVREMTLELILNDTPDKVTRTDFKNVRKIEHIENKENELISILAKSILDVNRHNLSIVEWAVQQLGRKMDLEISDYNNLLSMKLEDILKIIDKNI
jgi:hypothetical protein